MSSTIFGWISPIFLHIDYKPYRVSAEEVNTSVAEVRRIARNAWARQHPLYKVTYRFRRERRNRSVSSRL
jgi:hypothetical protein